MNKLILLSLLLLSISSIHCEEETEEVSAASDGHVKNVVDVLRGSLFAVYSKIREPEAAACFGNISMLYHIIDVIGEMAEGKRDPSFIEIAKLSLEIFSFGFGEYDGCRDVPHLYYHIVQIFRQAYDYPTSHWIQICQNGIMQGLALFNDIEYMDKHFKKQHFLQIGQKLGEILYTIVFYKMSMLRLPDDIVVLNEEPVIDEVEDYPSWVNVIIAIINTTTGIFDPIFSELGDIDSAACMEDFQLLIPKIYEIIAEIQSSKKTFQKILDVALIVISYGGEIYGDCNSVLLGFEEIVIEIIQVFQSTLFTWPQLLFNTASTLTSLFTTDIHYFQDLFTRSILHESRYLLLGNKIGEMVYSLLLHKMNDFAPIE
jgi:hypothetical protein